jgi:hypothetical protein
MVDIDLDAVAFYANHYMSIVAREHGPDGVGALQKIIEVLRQLYEKAIDLELRKGPIVVFKALSVDAQPLPINQAREIWDLMTLSQDASEAFVLQIVGNGRYWLWNDEHPDLVRLSEESVVYEWRGGIELFIAKGIRKEVVRIDPTASSIFAKATFGELRLALEEYRAKMVRYSSCPLFSLAWHDKSRLFFASAPEHRIRDSLTLFLKSYLRAHIEVRPEQNVDESHPVDIKVTWNGCNRLALIEIKWLGKARSDKGTITNDYGPARAKEGAKQLADYLAMNLQQAPLYLTRGYLVVVDARRYGMNDATVSLGRAHAVYYRDKEIAYDPQFELIRSDFERPIRMFAEPVC